MDTMLVGHLYRLNLLTPPVAGSSRSSFLQPAACAVVNLVVDRFIVASRRKFGAEERQRGAVPLTLFSHLILLNRLDVVTETHGEMWS